MRCAVPYVLLALVVVVVGGVILAEAPSPSSSSPSSGTRTIYMRVPGVALPPKVAPGTPPPIVQSPVAASVAPERISLAAITPKAPSSAKGATDALVSTFGAQAAPFAPEIASRGLGNASDLLGGKNLRDAPIGSTNPLPSVLAGNPVSAGLGRASDLAGGVNGVAGVVAFDLAEASRGFRGAGKEKQTAQLGQLALKGLQSALSAIPIPGVGAALSTLTGIGAQTYEGKRAVAEAGRITDQSYEFQKKWFSGDAFGAFSGGGRSHAQRVASFFDAVNVRVGQLASGKGGTITDQDIAAFGQAQNLGLKTVWANGKPGSAIVTLTNVNLKVGTNPFAGGARV